VLKRTAKEVAQAPRCLVGLILIGILCGCSRQAEPPKDTGARQCVQSFCEAVIQKDWAKGYAALDPQNQKRYNLQQFSQMAQIYLRGLDFEPETIQVRFCEEHDEEATGHVVLIGRTDGANRRYKDAFLMRKNEDGWGIILPAAWRAQVSNP
jgi:hypothetical protein